MLRWCWLVAGVALSCSSSQRRFSDNDNGGAAGQSRVEGASGSGSAGGAGSAFGGAGSAAAGSAGSAGSEAMGGDAGSEAMGGAAGSEAVGGDAGSAGVGEEPVCVGCSIASVCVLANAKNPENSCQICDVARSRTAYSADVGASCGASASECSAQDTCDARAVCQKNDLETGVHCATGACVAGACKPNPFDCIAPSPPVTSLTDEIYDFTGTPPAPTGGAIADGRYAPTRVNLYNSTATGINVRTFEFKTGFAQVATRYFSIETHGAFIPEVQFAGSFTTSGNVLKFALERCDPQYDIDIPALSYTASANGMTTTETLTDGSVVVTSYSRQ